MTHEEEFMQGRKNAHKLRDLWHGIAYSISSDAGFQMTGKEVREKWNNLRKEYLRQHSQVSKHGDDRVFWPFYWKMHEALGKVVSDETSSHGDVGISASGTMVGGQQADEKVPTSTGITLPTEAELPPYVPLDDEFMMQPMKRRKTATDIVVEAGLASDPSTQSTSYQHHHQHHHHQSVFDLRVRLEEAIAHAIPAMKRLEGVISDSVDFLSRLPRHDDKNDADASPG
jgi:hypothetical protein